MSFAQGAQAGEPVLGISVQGEPLPDRLKTAWGADDLCLEAPSVIRFFDKGMLWISEDELRFFPFAEIASAEPRGQGTEAVSLLFQNSDSPWHLTWNHERVWITRPGAVPEGENASQDQAAEMEVVAFRDCPGNEAQLRILYGEGYALYDALEGLHGACDGQPASTCAKAVFTWADVSQDNQLSVAELSRGARGLLFLEVFEERLVLREDLNSSLALSVIAGPLIGPAVMAALDYDGNNRLSFEEIVQDRLYFTSENGQEPELELRELVRELRRSATELGSSAGAYLQ
ncbi:hypothetical protein ACTL6U_04405 [Rhodovibrionaceae bacterium A322]